MDQLPVDTISQILSHLSLVHGAWASSVCAQWRHAWTVHLDSGFDWRYLYDYCARESNSENVDREIDAGLSRFLCAPSSSIRISASVECTLAATGWRSVCTVESLLNEMLHEMHSLTQDEHLFVPGAVHDMDMLFLSTVRNNSAGAPHSASSASAVFFAVYRCFMTPLQFIAVLGATFDRWQRKHSPAEKGRNRAILAIAKLVQLFIENHTVESVVLGNMESCTVSNSALLDLIDTKLSQLHHLDNALYGAECTAVCESFYTSFGVFVSVYLKHFWDTCIRLGLERRNQHTFPTIQNAGAPLLRCDGGDGSSSAACTLLDSYTAAEIARQLTIHEWQLFSSIRSEEYHGVRWRSSRRGTTDYIHESPHLVHCMKRFENVAMWVSELIVTPRTAEQRAHIYGKLLQVARELHDLRNFQTLFAVIAGFQSSAVHRLRATRALLSEEYDSLVTGYMLELVSLRNNFCFLRTVLQSCKDKQVPVIPYMGMYMSDLKAQHDHALNSAWAQVDAELRPQGVLVLNMTLLLEEYRVAEDLRWWQRNPRCSYYSHGHGLKVVPELYGELGSIVDTETPNRSAAQLYALSLQREPRE